MTAVQAPEPIRRFCPFGLPRTVEEYMDDEVGRTVMKQSTREPLALVGIGVDLRGTSIHECCYLCRV